MDIAALDAVECALLHENFAPLSGEIIFNRIEEIARGMGFEGELQALPSSTEKDVHVMAGEYRIMVSQNDQALAPDGFSQALQQPFVQTVFPEAQSKVDNHTANSFVTIAKGQPGEEPRPETMITMWEEAQGMMEFAVQLASLINNQHPASLVHWCPSDFIVSPSYFQEVASGEKFTSLYVCPFVYAPDGDAGTDDKSGLVANGSQWLIGKLLSFEANNLPLDWMHSRIVGFIEQVQEQNSIPENGVEFGMIEGEVIRVSHLNRPDAELQQIVLTFESSPEISSMQNEEEASPVSEPETTSETVAEEVPTSGIVSGASEEAVMEPQNEAAEMHGEFQPAPHAEETATMETEQQIATTVEDPVVQSAPVEADSETNMIAAMDATETEEVDTQVQEPAEPEIPVTVASETEEAATAPKMPEVAMAPETQSEVQAEPVAEVQPEPQTETGPDSEPHAEPRPMETQSEPNAVTNPVAASLKDLAEGLRTGELGNIAARAEVNPEPEQPATTPAENAENISPQDMQNMSMNDIVASVSSGPDNGLELTDQAQSAAMKPDDEPAPVHDEMQEGVPTVQVDDPAVESEFQEALKEEPVDQNIEQQAPMPLVQQAMAEAALQSEQQGSHRSGGVSDLDNFRALAQKGNARVRMAEATEEKKESFFQKAAGLFSRK